MALFSKKKTIQFEDIRTPEAKALGRDVLSSLRRGVAGYTAGADFGKTDVQLTQPEQQGLGYLGQYLQQDPRQNQLYQAGVQELTGTLAQDRYDPTQEGFYKATKAAIDKSQQEAIDVARRGQAVRGAFRSSGGLRQEGDIIAKSDIAQQQLLANLTERERERRQQAGQQAIALSKYEQNIPLMKTEASQVYGALERRNEIGNLEREYQKWSNQRNELMNIFKMGGEASNLGQPVYGRSSYTTRETTELGKALQFAAPAIGYYFGGSGGAALGSQIGRGAVQSGI